MNAPTALTFGVTPCPNDTYIVGAVATGELQPAEIALDIHMHDIEYLNLQALAGRLDVTKISCAMYRRLRDRYKLLRTGAALAEGYGPLVLAREPVAVTRLADVRIAVPGEYTTATLLFSHWCPQAGNTLSVPYDEIVPRLAAGEFDAGVVIHETRFTYSDAGLVSLADLGSWWTQQTGLPVPLGCYVIRRCLYDRFGRIVEDLMRASMAVAEAGNTVIDSYILDHAQETDPGIIKEYIGLYVNGYTRELGAAGLSAIMRLTSPDRICARVA